MRRFHKPGEEKRMVVILDPADYDDWLACSVEAASRYFGPHYIQHNPGAADGIEGFKQFLAFLRDKFPNYKSEIKRVVAEGDYVTLHVHNVREPGTRGRAIIDIFRLENGKIVEHWDVAQDIPEKMPHNNGMF